MTYAIEKATKPRKALSWEKEVRTGQFVSLDPDKVAQIVNARG